MTWQPTPAIGRDGSAPFRDRVIRYAESVAHDCGVSVRALLKSPGFTSVSIVSIAVGIGCVTSVLSVADAVFVGNVPPPARERTVAFTSITSGGRRESPNAVDSRQSEFWGRATIALSTRIDPMAVLRDEWRRLGAMDTAEDIRSRFNRDRVA